MFPILSSIPGIHATIVGILVAFFIAFICVAYQQIMEAQRDLEDAINLAKMNAIDVSCFSKYTKELLNDSGDVDWEMKGRQAIKDAKSFFLSEVIEISKFDLGENKAIEPEKIYILVERLMTLFYLLFKNYPMNLLQMKGGEQAQLNRINSLTSVEIQEIQNRITYLVWTWNTSKKSLLKLFQTYDDYKNKENFNRVEIERQRKINELEQYLELTSQDIQRINYSIGFDLHTIKLSNEMLDFFENINTIQDNILPTIKKSFNKLNLLKNTFQVKKLSSIMIYFSFFILITGIIIPLITYEILSGIENSHKQTLVSYLEYLLLTVSFLPYFIILYFFNTKIKKSFF
jgi:hypothetical protein